MKCEAETHIDAWAYIYIYLDHFDAMTLQLDVACVDLCVNVNAAYYRSDARLHDASHGVGHVRTWRYLVMPSAAYILYRSEQNPHLRHKTLALDKETPKIPPGI